MSPKLRSEGFRGQILHFTPVPLRMKVAMHPLASELYAVHMGWFPRARFHYIDRPDGAEENILIYCRSGCGWFEIGGRKRRIRAGQVLLIPRHTAHSYAADEADPWSIYWFHFAGDDAVAYRNSLRAPAYSFSVVAKEVKKIETLFRDACRILARGHTLRSMLLVSHILRYILGIMVFQGAGALTPPPAGPHDMMSSIAFMKANLSRPLSLKELAQNAGLSRARYSALFRRQIGAPPVVQHVRLRIQAACRLLDNTTLAIKVVAAEIGYEDPYHFSRTFRKIMGLSPMAYRRSQKG